MPRLEVATETTWGVGTLLKAFFIAVLPMVATALPTPAPSGPPPGPVSAVGTLAGGAADEISLANLGLASQTVRGPQGTIAVLFPAAGRDLASTGNFLSITFEHSGGAGAGASLDIAVNGHALTSVPLTEDTAAGSVLEVPMPPADLFSRRPNLFEARFSFPALPAGAARPSPAAPAGPFGRIDDETLVHYQLRASAGALASYPYSLLGADAGSPARVGLLVPGAPTTRELAVAFRLAADLGGRLWTRTVVPDLVASDQQAWAAAATEPALVVGRIDRLTLIRALLARMGFEPRAGTWVAPGTGQVIQPGAGVLAEIPPSGNQRSPLIVVTGSSDAAVDRAAETLIGAQRGLPPDGQPSAPPPLGFASSGAWPGVSGTVRRTVPVAGESRLALALPVGPLDRAAHGTLRLSFANPGTPRCGPASVSVEVNGRQAGSTTLTPGSTGPAAVPLPGGLLRDGLNLVLVRTSASCPRAPSPAGLRLELGRPGALTGGVAGGADLGSLPYPFLGTAASPLAVVLAGVDRPTLEAAATALVRLAQRAPDAPPPPLTVATTDQRGATAAAGSNVLVVGRPPAAGAASASSLQVGLGIQRLVGVGSAPACPGSAAASGSLQELALPGKDQRLLWIDGQGASLGGTASALRDPSLRGASAVVVASGAVCGVRSATTGLSVQSRPELLAAVGLILAAALLACLIVASELRLAWRSAR